MVNSYRQPTVTEVSEELALATAAGARLGAVGSAAGRYFDQQNPQAEG